MASNLLAMASNLRALVKSLRRKTNGLCIDWLLKVTPFAEYQAATTAPSLRRTWSGSKRHFTWHVLGEAFGPKPFLIQDPSPVSNALVGSGGSGKDRRDTSADAKKKGVLFLVTQW